ncbi:MAG: Jag N-terminal domain-containing protein, partial [Clostridia bacterium]|nr:Jag N-terminal domain-containing protein [Clostridia bacterium]
MENNTYIYEGKTVEEATQNGLLALGLSAEEVSVTVKSKGGLFTKAQVEISVLPKEEKVEEISATIDSTEESENVIDAVQEELLARAEERVRVFVKDLIIQMGIDSESEVTRSGAEIN